ncbi:heterodimeric geranylgeranyl pyrophosphate synthase small subunit, chloroplastic [Aristolochia californica]|uniref:heterodimeric geranylgeranyl pyrophosphate synthase small subunit, chloroplastic n=1 Tax=Aristolochia californica TaxID=171875 RepID=UPI0035DAC084
MAFSAVHFSPRLSLLKPRPTAPPRCSASISQVAAPAGHKPFDLQSYWTALIAEINDQLSHAIPIRYPPVIFESMRYSVLSKGAKRAAPVMCVAACELLGGDRAAAFPTACALEMVHVASLIHDDIPCMDDDPARRGSPSNHAVYGVDMAILTGDALFPLAFRHITTRTPTNIVPPDRLLRVVAEIARTVGSSGMAAGQFLDVTKPSGGDVDFVMEKKFGEMGQCSAVCGGILAGAQEEDVERLRRYGRAVGVLYEVVDDIREAVLEGSRTRAGYVGVYGLERAREAAEDLRTKAKQELEGLESYGDKVVPLYSFVDYATERGFDVGGGDVEGI